MKPRRTPKSKKAGAGGKEFERLLENAAGQQPPPWPVAVSRGRSAKARVALVAAEVASQMREQIERRAYGIYLGRGAAHGQDVADWLQAEGELSPTNIPSR